MKNRLPKIAIFASGNGSNAENIIRYFQERKTAVVSLVISNNKKAFVLERAAGLAIDSHIIGRDDFKQPKKLLSLLNEKGINFIVLAGFLWLIPTELILSYPQRIINIHPALLPKYGGKGMYGSYVHQAVSDAGETESGISIHFVNQAYDEGDIIFQETVAIEVGESPEKIAKKVQSLEYEFFPKIIEKVVKDM